MRLFEDVLFKLPSSSSMGRMRLHDPMQLDVFSKVNISTGWIDPRLKGCPGLPITDSPAGLQAIAYHYSWQDI